MGSKPVIQRPAPNAVGPSWQGLQNLPLAEVNEDKKKVKVLLILSIMLSIISLGLYFLYYKKGNKVYYYVASFILLISLFFYIWWYRSDK